MKILVTGANGYIGSKVVKQLCDLNVDVIATDFSNVNIDSRARYIEADIFKNDVNWFEYFDKPDVCLHLAYRDGFVHNSMKHMGDLSNHYNFMTNLIDNGWNANIICETPLRDIDALKMKELYESMI